MRRGYEKWTWANEAGEDWRCSECEATVDEASHKHSGKGRRQAKPYNEHQVTCSPACADARKVRRQRERREERRAEREAARARARERQRQQQQQQRARERAEREQRPTDEADAALLGVSTTVTREELKRAWRRKITAAHPDHHGSRPRRRPRR